MTAPTSFGLAFFLRVALPGIVASVLFAPILPPSLAVALNKDTIAFWLTMAAAFGLTLALLDTPIYRTFEGRMLWPRFLREWFTRRLERRVRQLEAELAVREEELAQARGQALPDEANILWLEREISLLTDQLLNFPWFGEGNPRPRAIWPTTFGNVLATWEYYPETRYGMDSVFYWYRLWLVADDNARKEIDTHWAYSQSLLYIAAVTGLASAILMLLAIWFLLMSLLTRVLPWLGPVGPFIRLLSEMYPTGAIAAGITGPSLLAERLFLVAGGYAIAYIGAYSITLTQHRVSGELTKALFDLYRHEIVPTTIEAEDRGAWEQAANRLQYLNGNRVLRKRWAK